MDFILDTHCHTLASGHAYSTIQEMALQAKAIGFELIALTEHGPAMPSGANLLYFDNLKVLPKKIYDVEILKGAEVNILDYDGTLDIPECTLMNLDFVIASLHPPCLPAGTVEEHTEALIKLMEKPYINMIGHPGNPYYPIDIVQVVKAAKATGTIIEINNSSLKPNSFRIGSRDNCCNILSECKAQGVPIALGSDAHISFDIGNFSHGVEMIQLLKVPAELVLNTSTELFKKAVARKRGQKLSRT